MPVIKGNILDYLKFGKGNQPLVIIPGLSIKSVMESAADIENAYSVFTGHTVYLFDARNDAPDGYTLWDYAEDIASLMQQLGISNADVFGASMGGMTAQCLTISHPDLVRRLVLGSTTSRLPVSANETLKERIELAREGRAAELAASFMEAIYSEATLKAFGKDIIASQADASASDLERFVSMAEASMNFSCYERLDEIKCPTLVIGCLGDRVLGYQPSADIAKKIGCQLYLYSRDYGHCVFDEAPDYKSRLIEFFSDPALTPSS